MHETFAASKIIDESIAMNFKALTVPALAIVMAAAPALAFAADKSGSFRSTSARYKVSGAVKVSANGTIRISSFRTSSGPDLYIYVGNGSASKRVAKLKRTSGTQTYKISPALAKSISSVHVYCKRFSTNFGTARVK